MFRAWRSASLRQRQLAAAGAALTLPPSLIFLHGRAIHLESDAKRAFGSFSNASGGNQTPPVEQATKQLVNLLDIDWPFGDWTVPSFQAKLSEISSGVFQSLSLPRYALLIPEVGQKLVAAFSFDEGSLGAQVMDEAHDLKRNPEMDMTARVRIGDGLCDEELEYLKKRRQFTRKALAAYIRVPESEIDERDIPIIGIAGSGGGLRACLATTCIYEVLQEEGLLDATTYLAGISGSTWAQALYMTIGSQNPTRVLSHLKRRITTHIANPVANLELLNDSALEKYLLRGILERWHQGYKDIGLVDLYGFMLTGRFLVPNNELIINDDYLKISSQRKVVESGSVPLAISSIVHHEIPVANIKTVKETSVSPGQKVIDDEKSYFQFFEVTPFEFGSEELSSWIPTWALGREFDKGQDIKKVPELKLTTLLGTFSSAFCASLSHYLAELQPLLPKSGLFKLINEQILSHDEEFKAITLVDATKVPNYVKGMRDILPKTVPAHFNQDADLTLCDAGMSNNLPFYPLLRRDVDILIAVDSSADIEVAPWFSRTEGYVKRRGIAGWPMGAGWPKTEDDAAAQLAEATASTTEEAHAKIDTAKQTTKKFGLSPVNIWVGQATKAEESASPDKRSVMAKRIEDDVECITDSSGLMLIYLPLLPNDSVPGIDPATSDFCSTWNFEWQPDQVDLLRDMTRANFDTGKERIRRAIKAMWQRKRDTRLAGGTQTGEQRSTPT